MKSELTQTVPTQHFSRNCFAGQPSVYQHVQVLHCKHHKALLLKNKQIQNLVKETNYSAHTVKPSSDHQSKAPQFSQSNHLSWNLS